MPLSATGANDIAVPCGAKNYSHTFASLPPSLPPSLPLPEPPRLSMLFEAVAACLLVLDVRESERAREWESERRREVKMERERQREEEEEERERRVKGGEEREGNG